jgi:hypothetical protein
MKKISRESKTKKKIQFYKFSPRIKRIKGGELHTGNFGEF